jgi:hypothetical protein
MPISSSGCRRCCSYGSPEQQKAMAEALAKFIDRGWQAENVFVCRQLACSACDVETPGNPEGLCYFCKHPLSRRQ